VSFTIDEINEIHDRLGKQETLPQYVQELNALGIEYAVSYVTDGHTEFIGKDGHRIKSPAAHQLLPITKTSNKYNFLRHLNLHREGKTSYVEMSRGLAESGTEKWVIDTNKLTMTFYDKDGDSLLVDKIE